MASAPCTLCRIPPLLTALGDSGPDVAPGGPLSFFSKKCYFPCPKMSDAEYFYQSAASAFKKQLGVISNKLVLYGKSFGAFF